ncbi:hypothetical protein F4808DRAFT_457912 [Astrocystis sublimbata]|nr:hypothetical protein F4808DRAFT_457912 [Astrocystis sublimbata]
MSSGGMKSKFRFPTLGRSKKQEVPTVSVTTPLSKAQRILGTDGLNINTSTLRLDTNQPWETSSAGGISTSVSESNLSRPAHDVGLELEDERNAFWEEESAIIPRPIRSAHGSHPRALKTKRSALTVGNNESRDNIASLSSRSRRQSTSTIDSHYESEKMPLAISQQTSSSAMAKGLPSKINELLDMDGSLAGTPNGKKKKKPARLDLSRLRPRGQRERKGSDQSAEPVYGTNYVSRSPSFFSQFPLPPDSGSTGNPRTPRWRTKQQPVVQESPRSKGITQPTGLHQLYDHYEKMSFHNEEALDEDTVQEYAPLKPASDHLRPASTFTQSLIAPIPSQSTQERDPRWSHSRKGSHGSRTSASMVDSPGGLQVNTGSRNDYAGSVSSRHTRTSKASPSSRDTHGSDRLQNSVLSLSDSSDEEDYAPSQPTPVSHRGSLTNDAYVEPLNSTTNQQSPKQLHGTTGNRKFTPSLNQVDEHSAFKSTMRVQDSNSPLCNTFTPTHSSLSHSSTSTLTPALLSAHDSRFSSRSTETSDTIGSPRSPWEVQQAMTVSYIPLASTFEAAGQVSTPAGSHQLDKVLLRQNSNATSHYSHSSDQPTPPLSPSSVEFYVKSRESLQIDAVTSSDASEAYNARMMAVTRQEEMLLGALRQKRAKMREGVISEADEDVQSRPSRDSVGHGKRSNKSRVHDGRGLMAMPELDESAEAWPKRASSLFIGISREDLRQADQENALRKQLGDVDVPSTASRSDATDRTSISAAGSTTSTTYEFRNDQSQLYFEPHTESTNTADSSVYFSDDYLDDSDGVDLIVNERRTSRMQSRRSSASANGRARSTSSRHRNSSRSSQHQNDSASTSSHHAAVKGHRLQDVPELEPQPECNEDVDADDSEDDIGAFPQPPRPPPTPTSQPPMPPPSWPLPPRPERKTSKPNSPAAPTDFLHPSSALQQAHSPKPKHGHTQNKRSMALLTAHHTALEIWFAFVDAEMQVKG